MRSHIRKTDQRSNFARLLRRLSAGSRRSRSLSLHPECLEDRSLLSGPTVPAGFSIATVAQLASEHLDGLVVDPGTGAIYVAGENQADGQLATYSNFDLWKITPASPSPVITQVGNFPITHFETTVLVWGPGGNIYTADTNGNVYAISPSAGTMSVYSNSGIGLDRYGMQFDQSGNLILMPSGFPNSFYQVTPGSGAVFLGSYTQNSGEFGEGFGIQPDGDYVIYPDRSNIISGKLAFVTEVNTAGHVPGTNFPIRDLTSTAYDATAPSGGLLIPTGHSIGAVDPQTGDVYATTANDGTGATRITFTPGEGGPSATTTIFVDQIGNNVLPRAGRTGGLSRGVTALAFGPRTDGAPGNSLFFVDDFTDTVYEVHSNSAAPAVLLNSSSPGHTSTYGDSVTFTATVPGNNGLVPTGSIQFFDGSSLLAAQSLDGTGSASVTISSLNAGSHSITAHYGGDSSFTSAVSAGLAQVVNRATPVFSQLVSASVTYGTQTATLSGTLSFGAAVPPGFINITAGGAGATALIDPSTGQFSASFPTFVLSAAASPYTITYSYPATTNFNSVTDTSQGLTVSKAQLTVTANSASKTYGDPNPGFTASFTGFVNGDDASAVSGLPAFDTSATDSSNVGTYPISVSLGSLVANNYTFTAFNPGVLTITPAHLTVTADHQTKTYGDPNPPLTATISGFVLGQTLATSGVVGAPGLDTTATDASNVGNYPITVSQGTLLATNYDFVAFNPGTLSITPAHLTVTADNQTKTYGDPNPPLTATISGFVLGQTLATSGVTGSPNLSTLATPSSGVGPYAITIGAGSLAASNYDFTVFQPGVLTVTPAHLVVTADNQTKVYGDANPPLTATVSGFVNGDDARVLTGAAGLSTSATAASGVGSYAITVAQGTLSAANYDFVTFIPGYLSITPAHLTVTADNQTRTYGDPNPPLTASISGFVNGDAASVVTGAAKLTTAAIQSSNVGSYGISVAQGTLAAANYDFTTFVPGTLVITPAHLTVIGDNQSRVFGASNPTLTATLAGFVLGQTLATSGVTGAADLSTPATSTSNAGLYPIYVGPGSLTAANYDFTAFIPGTLTVTKALPVLQGSKALTIIFRTGQTTISGSVQAGPNVPTGNVSISLNSTTLPAAINADGTFSATFSTAALPAGAYTISYGYAGNANFQPASASSSLTVTYGTQVLTDLSRARAGGGTLSIRLQVLDASGTNISSDGLPVTAVGFAPASNPGAIMPATSSDGDNDANNNRFEFDGNRYRFRLKLVDAAGRALSAGTYIFYYRIGTDPVVHSLQFLVS